MTAFMFAADLTPAEVGAHVVVSRTVEGFLEQVDRPRGGMARLTVDGATYVLFSDALVSVDELTAARLVAAGRACELTHARVDAVTHVAFAAIARKNAS